MSARKEYAICAVIGFGLAFGLGWLWFPWVSALWLPDLLWGNAVSGGGALFLLILICGFPLGGAIASSLAGSPVHERLTRFFHRYGRHSCHLAAFLCISLVISFSANRPAIFGPTLTYCALILAAVAHIILGIYWGGRLFALPSNLAPLSFLCAALMAVGVGYGLSFCNPAMQRAAWLISISIVWAASELLARWEKPLSSKMKGVRNGPFPNTPPQPAPIPPESPPGQSHIVFRLAVCFAAMGLVEGMAVTKSAGALSVTSLMPAGTAFALGTLVPVLSIRAPRIAIQRDLPPAALAVLCLLLSGAAALTWPSACFILQEITEGVLSGMGLLFLAGVNWEFGAAMRRAGNVAGACVLLVNGGRVAGECLAGITTLPLAVLPALAAGTALLWPFVKGLGKTTGADGIARPSEATGNLEANGNHPFAAPAMDALFFTEEETRLLLLLAREDLSNQDIAERLFITRDTVRYHLKKLYAKTDTSSRVELLRYAAPYLSPFRGTGEMTSDTPDNEHQEGTRQSASPQSFSTSSKEE